LRTCNVVRKTALRRGISRVNEETQHEREKSYLSFQPHPLTPPTGIERLTETDINTRQVRCKHSRIGSG
jgi:hypothetical protein